MLFDVYLIELVSCNRFVFFVIEIQNGILEAFIVALMPVLKVLLITVLGTFLALDRLDILSRETARKNLNTVSFISSISSINLHHKCFFFFVLKFLLYSC